MTSTLSDFCEVVWDQVMDMACLDVVMQATAITSAPPQSPEQMAEVFRLPRAVIAEAVDFTERYAAACLEARRDLPSMHIPDPWDAPRRASLEKRVTQAIARIARLAERDWALRYPAALVSASNARTTLLRELASRWEQGQRAHHQALQKCKATNTQAKLESMRVSKQNPQKGKPKQRDKSIKELLQELVDTQEGREKLLAARTVDGIAALIKCSHGAVAGCPVYKRKVRPILDTNKWQEKNARIEFDDRRLDRRSDRHRK